MKCHYRTCTRMANPLWIYNDWSVPFCNMHAAAMAAITDPHKPRIGNMSVDLPAYVAAIDRAAQNIREDAEFSNQALTHRG